MRSYVLDILNKFNKAFGFLNFRIYQLTELTPCVIIYIIMIDSSKRLKIVGEFIRKRRESLGISQRALGLHFNPPVTTQFISNVERGVTPLPPTHIPVLAKALLVSDSELMVLLEKEYAQKLNGRLGKSAESPSEDASKDALPSLIIEGPDFQFMRSLYDAYRGADEKTKQTFATVCESILNVSKSGSTHQ
jgi:transcriptional regulator with XRE-family HTH domain